MASHGDHGDEYHPTDAVSAAVKAGAMTAFAGAALSGVQNALAKQNLGPMGFVTKTGGSIAIFGAMGGAYEFTRYASANLRQKNDAYNPGIAGFVAGSILGLRYRTIPAVVGLGSLTAVVMSAYNYTGARLSGYEREPGVDEYERKVQLRKNRRKPVEETIEELGEGRGVYGAGYAERRAERLKERYGINVPAAAASSS